MRLAGTGIIIDKDKRILLLKRSSYTKAYPHHWTMPGGRGDPGESAQEIVIREVKEEAGIDFTPIKLYEAVEVENSGEMVHVHRYIGDWRGNVQIQAEEADGYAWYTYEETLSLKVAFNYRDTINSLKEDGLID